MVPKMHGYLNAQHTFGRSSIVRMQSSYFLRWQIHRKEKSDVFNVIPISRFHYDNIKKLLLSVRSTEKSEERNGIVYTHDTDSKTYMRIKRYLIKEKLL